jgi:hypothetical protein
VVDDLVTAIHAIQSLGAFGLTLLFIVALHKGWIVLGKTYDDQKADLDQCIETAERQHTRTETKLDILENEIYRRRDKTRDE